MLRRRSLVLLVLLSFSLLGGDCSEPEAVPLKELQKDVAPPFDYALYCDQVGTLVGERSAVLLVYRAEHLERVYTDAQAGNPRARALFRQLEQVVRHTGVLLADEALGVSCNSLPACVVEWHKLDELMPSRGEGGSRLRQVLADSFSREAPRKQVRNTVVAAVLDVLLVGTVLKAGASEAKAGMAEARAAAAEAGAGSVEASRLALASMEARLTAAEIPAMEARIAEVEALETAARHPAHMEALARRRPALAQPPPGVEADNKRWTSYVAYWNRRYEELAGTRSPSSRQIEARPPLTWDSYSALLGRFQSSLDFQRGVTRELQQQASGRAQTWLSGMKQPLVTDNMGLRLEGRATPVYVDQCVVDQATLGPGLRPSVHTFSNKLRDFTRMSPDEAIRRFNADLQEAHVKYSGMVEVRRPGHPLFGQKVEISQVHVVYDGRLVPVPIREALTQYARSRGATLHFHGN